MTEDVLIVLNPRHIDECLDAIRALPIDRLWLSHMTELEIERRWTAEALPLLEGYARAFIISDDAIPRPHALEALRRTLDEGHPVVTGYCNLASDDFRTNLTRAPLLPRISKESYDLLTVAEVMESPSPLVPTYYTGFCLTGMPLDLWRRYPYVTEKLGADGCAADYSLSRRLTDDGVPIVAHRDAFVWHVKERWSENDQDPRKRLLVGELPAEIRLESL